jgi:TPR repeat protein
MYLHGIGVKQDYSEALKWLQFAAARNEGSSYLYLGLMYQNG